MTISWDTVVTFSLMTNPREWRVQKPWQPGCIMHRSFVLRNDGGNSMIYPLPLSTQLLLSCQYGNSFTTDTPRWAETGLMGYHKVACWLWSLASNEISLREPTTCSSHFCVYKRAALACLSGGVPTYFSQRACQQTPNQNHISPFAQFTPVVCNTAST